MDNVARLSSEDRRDLFQTAAAKRGDLTPVIIEKDFWVCWCLRRIFSGAFPEKTLFKGGTSLSKVYGLIERFSEDVDLSLDRADLGFHAERDPAHPGISRKQSEKLVGELKAACEAHVRDQLLPSMDAAIEGLLGPTEDVGWAITVDPDDGQTLNFSYPTVTDSAQSAHIRQMIRLEIGAMSDHWPYETRAVRSYAAEILPAPFAEPECNVRVLSVERTFWEKATLLHALHHQPAEKPLRPGLSRHYYDLATIAAAEAGKKAIANLELLEAVAAHKMVFFRAAWAKYNEATPGSLRLVPPQAKLAALREDYARMQEMFFAEPPTLDAIMDTLRELEGKINAS